MTPTHISPSDLSLIAKAQSAVAQAQDRLQFVGQHIVDTYQLTETDTFNLQTGEITRATIEAS